MPTRRTFLAATTLLAAPTPTTLRTKWTQLLQQIATPVLQSLSQQRLKIEMPVEAPHGNRADRALYTHLEAFGRLLSGIAPLLESDSGVPNGFTALTRTALHAAVDPASPDFMNFEQGSQPVVDAAFLALGLLRAPNQLWKNLDTETQRLTLAALRSTRKIQPFFNNWLLFSATIEAFFCSIGEQWDPMRVDYAIRLHDEWYKGDGIYGDGANFHWDYYNSFVMQPMLLAILDAVKPQKGTDSWQSLRPTIEKRAKRYASIQERLIAPDGSFPAIGRSLAYRCGAFHHLATMSLRRELPDDVKPSQARTALTAVIKRTLDVPETFDANGFLKIGLCGHQPGIAEPYISTGSTYLCTAAFLPLGLPPTDEFWNTPDTDWSSRNVWSGQDVSADHALTD